MKGYVARKGDPLVRGRRLVAAEQTYNCLWSHAGGVPVHIRKVVQPVTAGQMAHHQAHGPGLQLAMFAQGVIPGADDIEDIAERARHEFGRAQGVA